MANGLYWAHTGRVIKKKGCLAASLDDEKSDGSPV
jgi:hypothetical protein